MEAKAKITFRQDGFVAVTWQINNNASGGNLIISYPFPLQNRVENKAPIRKRGSRQSGFALDVAGVRSPCPPKVVVFEVVAATIRLTEGVVRAKEGGRWMRNGVVEHINHTIVQFLGKVTVRVESGEYAETTGELNERERVQWQAR